MVLSNYFKEIDIIKGIAILTVVLEHSFAVKYVDLTSIGWCYETVEVIKSFNMQLFFIVSGFLFANSKTNNIVMAYRGKVDRILLPMLFLTTINILLTRAFPSLITFEKESTLLEQIRYALFHGESYWFLYTLFVIFCLIIPIKKYLSPKVLVLTGMILVAIKETINIETSVLQLNHVLYMSFFFLLGYLLYGYYEIVRVWLSKFYVVLPALLFYIVLYPLSGVSFVYNWLLPLSLGTVVWGGVILLSSLRYNYTVLKYLGKNSLQFYMFNGYALVPARILCVKLFKFNSPFLLVGTVFILSLFLLFILTEVSWRIPVVNYLCGFGRKK